jgi:hypothetical protein
MLIALIIVLFSTCDLLTGLLNNDGPTTTTSTLADNGNTGLSLSEALQHIPRPADMAPEVLSAMTSKSAARTLWAPTTEYRAIGFNTGRHMVNGGMNEFTAPFYAEILEGLSNNADKPQNMEIDLGKASSLDSFFPDGYTMKALWNLDEDGTHIKAGLKALSDDSSYTIRISIELVPEAGLLNSYKVASSIWFTFDYPDPTYKQELHVFCDYSESSGVYSSFIKLEGGEYVYQYSQLRKFVDGSKGLGMNTVSFNSDGSPDEATRYYSYGYSDSRGAVFEQFTPIGVSKGGAEYLDDRGEYESERARLDKYTYPDTLNLAMDTSGASPCLWDDANNNDTWDSEEKTIAAYIVDLSISEFMPAGYYMTMGAQVPLLDMPLDDPLWDSFIRKPGGVYHKPELHAKITGTNSIQSEFDLTYSLEPYKERIITFDELSFPGI